MAQLKHLNYSPPAVSVILPCRNEAGRIEACIESILAQEPPEGGFEIIVADGMSTDGTREYLKRMASDFPQIRIIKNLGRIAATGLNAAIRAAQGQIIIRMDAHTTFASDYIKQCVAVLNHTGADNVGGPARTIAKTYMERAISSAYHSPFSVGGAKFHDPDYEGYVDTVTYGCWRKKAFQRYGFFDEELVRNQDDEHNLRITRAGGKVYQSPRIRSWYHVRPSLLSLLRQYMQYGYWKVLVIQKHRMPASIRHLVPGAFAGGLLLSILAGLLWPPAFISLGAILAAYGLVILVASSLTARTSGWKLLPVLPIVFPCFHVGYGYGFLRGLFDFVFFRNAPAAQFVQLTRAERKERGLQAASALKPL